MGFNYTADEAFQMGMNSLERKFDEMIERRLAVVEKKLESDVRENRHGEWKWTDGGMCSECGFHNSNFDFNFCPNCGCDMRKGEKNELR